MTVRRGAYSNLAGVRLPSPVRPPSPADSAADPALGESVPRCHLCGMPDRPHVRLVEFELRLHGRFAGHSRQCELCYRRHNPPPLAVDPLDVSQTA